MDVIKTGSSPFQDYESRKEEGWSQGKWFVCSLLGCLFRVLILESVCVLTVCEAAEDIIAVSWPISLPQPPAPLCLWDAYWSLSLFLFFFSNRLSPYAGSSPPSMSPLVSCSPFHLLLPLSAPLLTIISYPSVILSAVFYNLASLLSVHHVGNNDDNGDDDELRCLLSVCHRHI